MQLINKNSYGFFFRTAIAIRGKDGVVFAVEKLVQSKLYEVGANKRIFNIDRHVGMVGEKGYFGSLVSRILLNSHIFTNDGNLSQKPNRMMFVFTYSTFFYCFTFRPLLVCWPTPGPWWKLPGTKLPNTGHNILSQFPSR